MNSTKRRILEIGHGGNPMKTHVFELAKKMPPDVEYHGVDLPWVEPEYRGHPHVFFYIMNARNLAFANGSFDEVHMHWVLSANETRVFAWDIAQEAYRVLRPGGRMVVTSEERDCHRVILAGIGLDIEHLSSTEQKQAREIVKELFSWEHQFFEESYKRRLLNCDEVLPLAFTILGGLLIDNINPKIESVVVARKP